MDLFDVKQLERPRNRRTKEHLHSVAENIFAIWLHNEENPGSAILSFIEGDVGFEPSPGCRENPGYFFPDFENLSELKTVEEVSSAATKNLNTESNAHRALSMCQRCPVQGSCLVTATIGSDEFGIRGGYPASWRKSTISHFKSLCRKYKSGDIEQSELDRHRDSYQKALKEFLPKFKVSIALGMPTRYDKKAV